MSATLWTLVPWQEIEVEHVSGESADSASGPGPSIAATDRNVEGSFALVGGEHGRLTARCPLKTDRVRDLPLSVPGGLIDGCCFPLAAGGGAAEASFVAIITYLPFRSVAGSREITTCPIVQDLHVWTHVTVKLGQTSIFSFF